MTVYVDNFEAPYQPKHRPGRTYVMCHMIADTDDELHAMADKIGVARKWFQKDHYDIAKSKRDLAIKFGAVKIDVRTLAAMATLRRFGGEIGDPSTARERMDAKWREIRAKSRSSPEPPQ